MAFRFSALETKHFDNVDNVNSLEILVDMYSESRLIQNEYVQKLL